MSKTVRVLIVLGGLAIVALGLAALGMLPREETTSSEPAPGRIHIYVDGEFVANVDPTEVGDLPQGSFVDEEKDKTQEGPWAEELIALYVDVDRLRPESLVAVHGTRPSGGETKEATLAWGQITDRDNHVILDIAGSGDALKLVSTLPELDIRDEWVQGVARIDITTRH